MSDEQWEWDEVVEIRAFVRVRANPNPRWFEGWQNRTPAGLAKQVVYMADRDPEHMDGWADLTGSVYVEHVEAEP